MSGAPHWTWAALDCLRPVTRAVQMAEVHVVAKYATIASVAGASAAVAYLAAACEADKTIYRCTGSSRSHLQRRGYRHQDCVRSEVQV